jgi:hypothetical protein
LTSAASEWPSTEIVPGRVEDAHHHADRRRLAGAVLAEEPVDAALGILERQIATPP